MSETKWSKGEWKVCSGDKKSGGICSCFTISATDHPIARVEHGEWGDSYPSLRWVEGTHSLDRKVEAYIERTPYGSIPEEESVANACVMAAAPDLYKALEIARGSVVLRFDEWDGVNSDVADDYKEQLVTIDAALAKARGESK